MKARLSIQIKGHPHREVVLDAPFTIGRDPQNTLSLSDSLASRKHALIRLQDDRAYHLYDLKTSNGTLLNGEKINHSSPLKSGDEIQIGDCIFHFRLDPPKAKSDRDRAAPDTRSSIENSPQKKAKVAVVTNGAPPHTIELGPSLSIGRSSQNDLVLDDSLISRNHAVIQLEGRHYFFEDLGTQNGSLLNEQPIRGRIALSSGDKIQIGSSKIEFHEEEIARERKKEKSLPNALQEEALRKIRFRQQIRSYIYEILTAVILIFLLIFNGLTVEWPLLSAVARSRAKDHIRVHGHYAYFLKPEGLVIHFTRISNSLSQEELVDALTEMAKSTRGYAFTGSPFYSVEFALGWDKKFAVRGETWQALANHAETWSIAQKISLLADNLYSADGNAAIKDPPDNPLLLQRKREEVFVNFHQTLTGKQLDPIKSTKSPEANTL